MITATGHPTGIRRRHQRLEGQGRQARVGAALVRDALDALPPWVQERLAEVAVVVEAEPAAHEDPALLGLYSGPTLFADQSLAVPPLIRIFQRPHERLCRTRQELRREVVETVLHEIAHHFGFDEPAVARLGRLRLPDPDKRHASQRRAETASNDRRPGKAATTVFRDTTLLRGNPPPRCSLTISPPCLRHKR